MSKHRRTTLWLGLVAAVAVSAGAEDKKNRETFTATVLQTRTCACRGVAPSSSR